MCFAFGIVPVSVHLRVHGNVGSFYEGVLMCGPNVVGLPFRFCSPDDLGSPLLWLYPAVGGITGAGLVENFKSLALLPFFSHWSSLSGFTEWLPVAADSPPKCKPISRQGAASYACLCLLLARVAALTHSLTGPEPEKTLPALLPMPKIQQKVLFNFFCFTLRIITWIQGQVSWNWNVYVALSWSLFCIGYFCQFVYLFMWSYNFWKTCFMYHFVLVFLI